MLLKSLSSSGAIVGNSDDKLWGCVYRNKCSYFFYEKNSWKMQHMSSMCSCWWCRIEKLVCNSNIWYILGKIMGVTIDWDVWLLLMFNSSEWILFVMNSIYYLLIVSGCWLINFMNETRKLFKIWWLYIYNLISDEKW